MRSWKLCLLAALAVSTAAVLGAGEMLSRPARAVIGPAPADLQALPVSLRTMSGLQVSGWSMAGQARAGVVLLLHGVRGDRRDMIGRARFLNALGHAVLLIDLPSHGESEGERITFGLHEAEGVQAALAWVAERHPGERVGVVGVSLGAASLVLSPPRPAPAAVVLESMYPSIEEAVSERLRLHLGGGGPVLAPLLLAQFPLRLGVSPAQLHPIDHIARLQAPLLLISGALDRHTTEEQTRRLFAAAAEPKALWIVDGAAHVNLHAFAPAEYEARVSAFLSTHLRQRASD